MISNLAGNGCSDVTSSLEAKGHSSEESNIITDVQEPKVKETISNKKDKNSFDNELPDLSASTRKRRQSPHSSPEIIDPIDRETKGGSDTPIARKQRSRSKIDNSTLRTFVLSRLSQYASKDGRYNGIIRILADAGFLQSCYLLIKGKPGNMSPGSTKETLDGLTYK